MSSLPVDAHHSTRLVAVRTAFGLAPYIRVAYALSDADLQAACERILAACKRLTPA